MVAVDSLAFAESLNHAVPGFNLQGQDLFELIEQHLGLMRVVPAALEFSHKGELRLDALLTFQDMLVGKLKTLGGRIPIDCRVHDLQLTAQCQSLFRQGRDEPQAA